MLALLVFLIAVALVFDFLNGRNDAANSIATIVSTRVLAPRYAVAWAAFFNFIAFLVFGLHVASTIGRGIITPDAISDTVIFGALMGAISWNLTAGYLGIPTSSSHALIGGLIGAGVAHTGFSAIVWSGVGKTAAAIVLSPITGLVIALLLMLAVSWAFVRAVPAKVDGIFRKVQFVSAARYWLGQGGNDAQKTMGIIAALLAAHGQLPGRVSHPALGRDRLQRRDGAGDSAWRLANCAYDGHADHRTSRRFRACARNGGLDHLVPGNQPRHPGLDDCKPSRVRDRRCRL